MPAATASTLNQELLGFKKKFEDLFTENFKKKLSEQLEEAILAQSHIVQTREQLSSEEVLALEKSAEEADNIRHALETLALEACKMVDKNKLKPDEDALVTSAIKSASIYLDALENTIEPEKKSARKNVPSLQKAALDLKLVTTEVQKKMDKPVWKYFAGALCYVTGLFSVFAGFLSAKLGVGVALIVGGVSLMGIGGVCLAKTKKEKSSRFIGYAGKFLNQSAAFFAPPQLPAQDDQTKLCAFTPKGARSLKPN